MSGEKEASMSGTIDLGVYEVRQWAEAENGGELFCSFAPGWDLEKVVRAARSLVCDGPLYKAELWITSKILGSAAVCLLSENEWEPLGPACTLERRLVLYREYSPDNFKGYRWGGLDARAGWDSTEYEFSEELVLKLAEDCREADYLTDEDDFDTLAGQLAEDADQMASDEWLCVGGEIWCEEPLMALQRARVMAAEGSVVYIGKNGEAVACAVLAGGLEVVGGVNGEGPVPEPFASLISEGW